MHVFKRIYLLASLVAALLIPALVFNEYVEVLPTTYVTAQEYAVPQATAGPIGIPQALEKDVLDIQPILWTVYFIGVLFFGIKFLKNLIQIGRRIQKNPKQKWEQFIHVLLNDALPPHTFLSYIFLNKQKFEAQEIPKEVLLHEQTHARQRHSYDILFVEFLQVIFWINPFIYLLKKAIKLNHEFLADEAVLNKNISKANYQYTLLSYLSEDIQHNPSPLVNTLNYSSIKKRFTSMIINT
jgi:beta-lactamase regulating signal transducer with metallopeptidase domain